MFSGSIVALVTPFKDDHIDEESLRDLVEFHIDSGTQALVAAGTTGESGTLTHQEKCQVIRIVVEAARERIPVIAGTAANATKACIELTAEAMNCGVHAALIMTPAYIKPTQEGLFLHYQAIARSSAIPIILYNVPGRTACDLLPETVARLSTISNIIGIKEATGEIDRLQALIQQTEGRMDIYSGDDITCADWMLAGAKGVISVTANLAPAQMRRLCELALAGNDAVCQALQLQLRPLHQALFTESNPIPVKWALSRMGRMSGELRMPLLPLSSQYHEALAALIAALPSMQIN
jgi:4-hydroxy-tetrahydrodipicolinate synthase